jgi:Cu(I)/Ag(I) efflux system protein CusF
MTLAKTTAVVGVLLAVGVIHGTAQADAQGSGLINSIDADKGVVNITHGPIPALSWPEMTMDLPVTGNVDLDDIASGDEVRFQVELGPDQVYRMTAVEQTD